MTQKFDIQRLLEKRQLNVQEQNALVAHRLNETAKAWQTQGVPHALQEYAQAQGVDWSTTLVLKLEVDFPGMPSLYGLLLTGDERFIAFELETDNAHLHVEAVEQWQDVSAAQDYSAHNRGKGQGFGFIALEVSRELLQRQARIAIGKNWTFRPLFNFPPGGPGLSPHERISYVLGIPIAKRLKYTRMMASITPKVNLYEIM